MRSVFSKWLALLAVSIASLASVASAEVKLPAVFGDHMVLQCDAELPVWGWANPGEKVTVTLGKQTETATAGDEGKWKLKLGAVKAGGPHTLKVQGSNTIELTDVLAGEVWLCSGQSNMAMTVSRALDFEKEAAASDLPKIRMLTVERIVGLTPQDDCQAEWAVCSPETVGAFSAAAFFFGRELNKELDVPVGLINSSWGGTPVQAWTCMKCQSAEPRLKPILDPWEEKLAVPFDAEAANANLEKALERWKEAVKKAREEGKQPPRRPRGQADPALDSHRPGNLFNGMIAPLAPYAIRGAIWYQGESNAGRYQSDLYGLQLGMMIENWRRIWGQGDFPFEWVQLPNFHTPQEAPVESSGWVIVQEQMLKTLQVPNTGMAVTIGIGEAGNIHPKNKQDVGKRLALWALAKTYGQDVVACGPLYKSMSKKGGQVVLSFDHLGGGLVAEGGKLKGFAIAGADKEFVWANAEIAGDTVVVSCPAVKKPAAVRYAWADNPDCNLYNKAGLPASPFRTDDWPIALPEE